MNGKEAGMKECNAVSVLWATAPGSGTVRVTSGEAANVAVTCGSGGVEGERFTFASDGPGRLEVVISGAVVASGSGATIVRIDSPFGSFSFFLRDVRTAGALVVPDCRAVVTLADDSRTFEEITAAAMTGKRSGFRHMEEEAEETYAHAAALGRSMKLPAILGLGRDCRVFHVDVDHEGGHWGWFQAGYGHYPVFLTYPHEPNDPRFEYTYVLGRGMGCQLEIERRLEDGFLPLLRGRGTDGDITYDVTAFVTLEKRLLTEGPVRGTPAMFATAMAAGFNLEPAEAEEFQRKRTEGAADELEADNLTALMLRAVATNRADVPRYAFFKSPFPFSGPRGREAIPHRYEPETGFLLVTDDEKVGTITRLDGRCMPLAELSVLLPPGGTAVLDLVAPHSPCTRARAAAMAEMDFDDRLEDCRAYWRAKAATLPELSLPEKHIEERMKAGLFQLDLVTYGRDDEPALSVPAGLCYPPIGSESLPSIFFYDAMGWHDAARRGLMFFLERQREDGFIQVYAHYMIETGAVLFGLTEHYRYTRDDAWVEQILPRLRKLCDYLLQWRRRNQRPELRGKGYGMLDGPVDDDLDQTPYFVNSGYACAGLRGAAEMVGRIDPKLARSLAAEAEAFRQDIRAEFAESMAGSPVVPLADGTWRAAAPPWAGHPGPVMLFAEPRAVFSHHAFTTRDSVAGAVSLIFHGILDPDEPLAEQMLQTHHALMTVHNVAFCQQYYSRHDYAHLARGEAKAFLHDYYHSLSLADPDIYSFWEHFSENDAGQYKTHEQGWFLMQCRWMLYLERGNTLRLLPGVPRAWLESGKTITVDGMKSHFGPLSFHVESAADDGHIAACVACSSKHRPRRVEIRLPHPDGPRAGQASGGRYDTARETIIIDDFDGQAEVTVVFD